MFVGSHYFKFQEKDEETLTFIQGEDFTGILVLLLWPVMKKELQSLHLSMNSEIKQECEK